MTRATSTTEPGATTWVPACHVDAIVRDTGVCASIAGHQVAIFRLRDGRLFALENRDPFSAANVLARGIVGDAAGVAVVASPMYKQRFALETGRCLDAPDVAVPTFEVQVRAGVVHVRLPG